MPPELFPGSPIPLEAQLQCVERELAMRRRVYAHRVLTGKMKQSQADKEIALMTAVRETLLAMAVPVSPARICRLVEDYEFSLEDRAAAQEFLTRILAGLSGIAAAAIGVSATHALLDSCKEAAAEAAAEFKARAN